MSKFIKTGLDVLINAVEHAIPAQIHFMVSGVV